jgi:hypothetical protein
MLWAAVVAAVAATAPNIVLTGGGHHHPHEQVAGPGGILGVEPAGEQDAQQLIAHPGIAADRAAAVGDLHPGRRARA